MYTDLSSGVRRAVDRTVGAAERGVEKARRASGNLLRRGDSSRPGTASTTEGGPSGGTFAQGGASAQGGVSAEDEPLAQGGPSAQASDLVEGGGPAQSTDPVEGGGLAHGDYATRQGRTFKGPADPLRSRIWQALRLPADWNDEKNEELLDDLERAITSLHGNLSAKDRDLALDKDAEFVRRLDNIARANLNPGKCIAARLCRQEDGIEANGMTTRCRHCKDHSFPQSPRRSGQKGHLCWTVTG